MAKKRMEERRRLRGVEGNSYEELGLGLRDQGKEKLEIFVIQRWGESIFCRILFV